MKQKRQKSIGFNLHNKSPFIVSDYNSNVFVWKLKCVNTKMLKVLCVNVLSVVCTFELKRVCCVLKFLVYKNDKMQSLVNQQRVKMMFKWMDWESCLS